jgi:hypothetical protein
MSVLDMVAVVAIIGYVLARQLHGEALKGKRLILLPAILAIVGVTELAGHGHHPGTTDIVMLGIGAAVSAGIGIAQGSMMHLEARNGALWGQMPRRSLWWWLALVVSHLLLDVVSSGLGAHVAASTAPLLMTLGVNRLAQAAVIAPRAMAAGIPFAPENDGSTFLAGSLGRDYQQHAQPSSPDEPTWTQPRRRHETAIAEGWQSGLSMIADRRAERRARR